MEVNMKCYVVEDLLPEYIEDLCSAETTAEIEAHLEGCEHCKEILEGMKAENESLDGSTPVGAEDIKPFQKVKKKMKRERIKKIVAIVALVAVCGFFGVLTVSQMFPLIPLPSYDSLRYRYEGWKVAKKLVEGDMRQVLAGTSGELPILLFNDREIIFEDFVDKLSELQRSLFEGKDVDIHLDGVTYAGADYGYSPEIYEQDHGYWVDLTFTVGNDNIYLRIYFNTIEDYSLTITTDEERIRSQFYNETITPAQAKNMLECNVRKMNAYFTYYEDSCCMDNVPLAFSNIDISGLDAELLKDKTTLWRAGSYFTNDCQELNLSGKDPYESDYTLDIKNYLLKITSRCKSNTFQLTNNTYNKEEKLFNATLYWTITDLKGKSCIMTKAFYYGPMGYEAVDNTEKIYADEGFDKEILKHLEKIFDKS